MSGEEQKRKENKLFNLKPNIMEILNIGSQIRNQRNKKLISNILTLGFM